MNHYDFEPRQQYLHQITVLFFFRQCLFITEPCLSWNSLCRQVWSQTQRNPSAFASQVLGLRAYTIILGQITTLWKKHFQHITQTLCIYTVLSWKQLCGISTRERTFIDKITFESVGRQKREPETLKILNVVNNDSFSGFYEWPSSSCYSGKVHG